MTKAAVLPGVSRTSRIAIASASASSVSLSATMIATASSAAATAGPDSAASRSRQHSVEFCGTERLAEECGARDQRRRRRAERHDVLAADSDDADEPMQKRLRMAGESLRGLAACADHRPGAIVEAAVETWKHDRALFAARNGRDERGSRAVGPGRARDDGGPAPGAGRERGDLGLDQERHALGAIDETVFGEPLRPMGEGDPEEVEGDAPIGVVAIRRQSFELPPVDALDDHVVDQRREVACERIGLRGGRGDQRGFVAVEHEAAVGVDAADRAAQRLAPGANERRQRVAAGQFADGGRQPGGGASSPSGSKNAVASSGSKAPSGAMRGRRMLSTPLAASSASASAPAARCVGT